MIFLGLLLIPTLIALGMLIFARKRITILEFGIQMAVQVAVAGISIAIIYHANVSDQEILNGAVTSKTRDRVSCRHSYQCNCYTTCSGGKTQTCSTHCSTCYEHSYDIDWTVHTNVNRDIDIDTVDRQGLREPPRWTQVQVAEPVAFSHNFDNYIKASPDTLFRYQGLVEKYKDKLPAYPLHIYDYYRIDRVVLVNGAALPDLPTWNQKLSEINGRLGPTKQANIVMVVAKAMPDDYFYALSQHWLGGKKNDVIVLLDTADGTRIDWAGVMSWTDRQILKVALRDDLMAVGTLDANQIFPVIEQQVSTLFVRKQMKDFEYLTGQITPSETQFMVSAFISIAVSVAISIFFFNTDPFEDFEDEHGIGNHPQRKRREWV